MKTTNVFKIAAADSRVREYLAGQGWEFEGMDLEMEMDSYKDKKTGRRLFIEDISDGFTVTFLMGELTLEEFSDVAGSLTPETALMEVRSSWEGRPATIVVAMSEEQVKDMFGRRTKMRRHPVLPPMAGSRKQTSHVRGE